MVDLKYKRNKLPVLRLFVYIIILIAIVVMIIKSREIYSFLEVLTR
jgi:hypothetical protein